MEPAAGVGGEVLIFMIQRGGGDCVSSQQMKPSGAVSQNSVVARVSLH